MVYIGVSIKGYSPYTTTHFYGQMTGSNKDKQLNGIQWLSHCSLLKLSRFLDRTLANLLARHPPSLSTLIFTEAKFFLSH